MLNRTRIYLLLTLVFSVLSACVTTKKRNEASLVKKTYHNITAEYNGYFNANVLYTEAIDKLNVQHQDNYTQILDLYPYVAVDNPKAIAPDMDNGIKKLSIVISLHRVSDWVDDSYLLYAKSQFLKQDFEGALETLEYLTDNFNPDLKSKKTYSTRDRKAAAKEKKKEKEEQKKEVTKEKNTEKKEKEKEKEAKKKEKEQLKKEKEKAKKLAAKNKKKNKLTSSSKEDRPKVSDAENPENKKEKKEEAKKEDKKVVEKAKTKPKSYLFKHRPCYQEARLWLARTYIERKEFDKASDILRDMWADGATFNDVRRDLASVRAYFFLKQKDYNRAIEPLQEAIEISKSKKEKARLSFILAQILQRNEQGAEAIAAYKKVLRYRPTYDMEFNARLNITQDAWSSGTSTAAESIAKLARMGKDSKNDDYRDQIYYSMAQVSLKNNQKPEAIDYLTKSLRYSTKNQPQKAESYLQLATLYYDAEVFGKAKNYYDSTLQVLSKTDDRFDKVSRFASSLTDIAKNIDIINTQDSLLKLNAMSDKDRREVALKIKKKRDEEARLVLANKIAGNRAGGSSAKFNPRATINPDGAIIPGGDLNAAKASTFFAYSDKALKAGKRDFVRKWSTRKNDDNWRRSNRKNANTDLATDEVKNTTSTTNSSDISDKEIDEIMKDVPKSESDVNAAKEKIKNALFTLGKLYRDKITYYKKSATTLETLLDKYADEKIELETWYYLYLDHGDLKDKAKQKIYYDKIVAKYPNTTYARVLQDPNFIVATKMQEKELNDYYDATYQLFQKGKYQDATDRINAAEKKFGEKNIYRPKFALLGAMCIGNLQGKESYIKSLKEVISKFPETAEQKRAKEMLRLLDPNAALGTGINAATDVKPNAGSDDPFIVENDKTHYVIVVLSNKDADLEATKTIVAEYNRSYHQLENLKVSNMFLGDDTEQRPIVVIRKFDNKASAMGYYEGVKKNAQSYIVSERYTMFAITQNNYRELLKLKNTDSYKSFFEKYYFKD